MYLIGFPLLLIPFVLYNIFAFIFGITDWNAACDVGADHLRRRMEDRIAGDLLITLSILLLFVEIMKSTRDRHARHHRSHAVDAAVHRA